MTKPIIALAEISDLPCLNEISLAAKQHWNYPADWLAAWRKDLQVSEDYLKRHHVYKMVLEERIIGFIALEEENNQLEIAHLWILPAYIGKGFGKRLLNSVLALVDAPGVRLLVTADPYAEGFYQRLGFTTFNRVESYPPGRFLPQMQKFYLPHKRP